MHPTANQLGCQRELAANAVEYAAAEFGRQAAIAGEGYREINMSGLDVLLMQNPEDWDERTDRHTNLALDYAAWEALFFKVLGCPDTEQVEDESRNAFHLRYAQNFREAIPEYPLLGRISYFFHDVWYAPDELMRLRNECQSVRNKTHDKEAVEGLDTLMAGCDEAQQYNLGLFLGAD